MDSILKYFTNLSALQQQQLGQLGELYRDWNQKVNVISRKDIDNLYPHHVLHSLSIAKFISFRPGSDVLDVGAGGGFPGIPLAILFPKTHFHLVDSVRKKVKVMDAIVEATGLRNVSTDHIRAEQVQARYDFVVTRAVAPMPTLYNWTRRLIKKKSLHERLNGIIALKGGDLREELASFGDKAEVISLSHYFEEEFFQTKKLVYLPTASQRG